MTVASMMRRALLYGVVAVVAVGGVAALIGGVTQGVPGVLGGILGAAVAGLFLGLTAVSILIAGRVTRDDPANPIFFAIVLGIWVIKLIAFMLAAIFIRAWDAVDPVVFFGAAIAAVVLSLIGDVVAFARTRVPYVSDVTLPGGGPQNP